MKIEDALEKYDMSVRLWNALNGSRNIWKTIEGVNLKHLLNRRNVGRCTFNEFLDLKEKIKEDN